MLFRESSIAVYCLSVIFAWWTRNQNTDVPFTAPPTSMWWVLIQATSCPRPAILAFTAFSRTLTLEASQDLLKGETRHCSVSLFLCYLTMLDKLFKEKQCFLLTVPWFRHDVGSYRNLNLSRVLVVHISFLHVRCGVYSWIERSLLVTSQAILDRAPLTILIGVPAFSWKTMLIHPHLFLPLKSLLAIWSSKESQTSWKQVLQKLGKNIILCALVRLLSREQNHMVGGCLCWFPSNCRQEEDEVILIWLEFIW